MGKSAHKSKKRGRSNSRDRIAKLEAKVARLMDMLTQGEVRRPRSLSPSSPFSSSPGREKASKSSFLSLTADRGEEEPSQVQVASERDTTVPVSQEGPSARENAGVYEPSGSIFAEYGRNNRHSLSRNNSVLSLDDDSLARELFASDLDKEIALPWNDLVKDQWRELVRKGLPTDQRTSLLKKYCPTETLTFLKAPRLNPELESGLKSNSVIKRDKYNSREQDQAGVALCAFGEAISELLKPEIQRSLDSEARSALRKLSEGTKILADLFYRLSLSRRAQIMPTLNLLAKNTAEHIPPDEFLFGESFGEVMKRASSLEKSSKELVRPSPVATKGTYQPTRQQRQLASSASRSGNSRAPGIPRVSATRRSGAPSYNRRVPQRARSHSRRR